MHSRIRASSADLLVCAPMVPSLPYRRMGGPEIDTAAACRSRRLSFDPRAGRGAVKTVPEERNGHGKADLRQPAGEGPEAVRELLHVPRLRLQPAVHRR